MVSLIGGVVRTCSCGVCINLIPISDSDFGKEGHYILHTEIQTVSLQWVLCDQCVLKCLMYVHVPGAM